MKRFWRRVREFIEAARWGGLFSFQPTVPPFICSQCDFPLRMHPNDACDVLPAILSEGNYPRKEDV